ncbi:GDSL-type esterase/lipase family protein [Microvirga ossetica]|nr:GDSL-type esterase/lipase family protein [Microvirga ossetica]
MHTTLLLATLLLTTFCCGVLVGYYGSPHLEPIKRVLRPIRQFVWASKKRSVYDQPMAGRVTVYDSLPGTAEIVMLGDSLTDWGNWDELLPGLDIINRGIGGDTSGGVLTRLKEISQRNPKTVVLMIGINDILQDSSPELVALNIKQTVRSLRENKIRVILQSVLLMDATTGQRANRKVKRLNTFLRHIAAEESTQFLDLNTVLAPNGTLHPELTRDGLHLAGRGYILWAESLRPLL